MCAAHQIIFHAHWYNSKPKQKQANIYQPWVCHHLYKKVRPRMSITQNWTWTWEIHGVMDAQMYIGRTHVFVLHAKHICEMASFYWDKPAALSTVWWEQTLETNWAHLEMQHVASPAKARFTTLQTLCNHTTYNISNNSETEQSLLPFKSKQRLWSHPTCWRYINKTIIIIIKHSCRVKICKHTPMPRCPMSISYRVAQ